jgi:quercetin dioxygenase-like cupin family protein
MSKRAIFAFVGAAIVLIGASGWIQTEAQDQPIKRTTLLTTDLAGIDGKQFVVYVADVAPGAAVGRHTHYGDEFVYILEGSLVVEPDGKDPITLTKGQIGHLTPDVVHAARNGSESEPARVLVTLVVDKEKPLAVLVQ